MTALAELSTSEYLHEVVRRAQHEADLLRAENAKLRRVAAIAHDALSAVVWSPRERQQQLALLELLEHVLARETPR